VADADLTVSASKTTGARVIHTATNTWDIPYCSHCIEHIQAAQAAREISWIIAFLFVVIAVLCCLATPYLGIPVAVLELLGTKLLFNRHMAQARRLCLPTCVTVNKAASYFGWHGSLHQFEFASQDFALAFMIANQGKLVNLSQKASHLLAASGCMPTGNAARSRKRYWS
jgi:hypothetical protein